jgi:hypothetical protein
MGARNRVGIGLPYRPPATQAGEIDSLESILGLLKSLKIRAQESNRFRGIDSATLCCLAGPYDKNELLYQPARLGIGSWVP